MSREPGLGLVRRGHAFTGRSVAEQLPGLTTLRAQSTCFAILS